MKIIKPQTLSLLTRPFEFRREYWLGVAVIAFLPVGETAVLLEETALWPFLAEELPPDQPLDAVIPKLQPEYLAVAHCYAPSGEALPLVRTGIQLGPLIKLLDVYGDRAFDQNAKRITESVPFKHMAMDWTRAYGGAGFADNPLGRGIAPAAGTDGQIVPVHNIVNPKLGREGARIPAAYSAVDQMWPARAKLAGTFDDAWLKQDFPGFARDIDWHYFNTASRDQWLPEALAGDETYAFKNLHPDKPLLKGRLPGMLPRLFLVRKDEDDSFEEVPLALTTVWFFPHRERLVLLHHGRARLVEEDGSDIARVVIGADRIGAPRPVEHYHAVMVQRTEPRERGLHALRDADLVPAEWLQPAAALAAPDAEELAMQQVLERQRKRSEREHAAVREQVRAQGLDPDEYGPASLPPEQPAPTLEELPAFFESVRKQAAEQQAEAQAAAAAKNAEIAAELAAAGVTDDEIQQRLNAKAKGPPAFSVVAMQAEAAAQITAMRVLGQLTVEFEASLASPETVAQWQNAETGLRNAYRLTAQHQDFSRCVAGRTKCGDPQDGRGRHCSSACDV